MSTHRGSKFEVDIDPSSSFSFEVNPALHWPSNQFESKIISTYVQPESFPVVVYRPPPLHTYGVAAEKRTGR